jgi:hypothetical protein
MLFREDIEPKCEYCRYGSSLGYDEVVCVKRGVFLATAHCAKFKYDPTKRRPEMRPKLDTSKLKKEDFALE